MDASSSLQAVLLPQQLVWVANHARFPSAWHQARIVTKDGAHYVIRYEGTKNQDRKAAGLLEPANPPELFEESLPNDVTGLSYLNCPSIYDLIKSRFNAEDDGGIYTNAGPVLVALNPCRELTIFSPEVQQGYISAYTTAWGCNNKVLDGMPPHIYKVAAQAYRQMVQQQQSQAVVVTGESGAGKTETTKLLMAFLASLSGASGLAERMLQSNPILEAFGNAKTSRNPNSSRFGKLLSIHFAPDPTTPTPPITCASMATYLLEKSRVVQPSGGERNYHIFYMLLRGASEGERERWHLPPPEDAHPARRFAYLRDGLEEVPGRDEWAEWQEMRAAMATVGLGADEQEGVLRLVAGVLWLGNIEFCEAGRGGDYAAVAPGEALGNAASLLRLQQDGLQRALTCKVLRQDSIEVQYTREEAAVARDSLAKALYSDLFDHIVATINVQLQHDGPQGGSRKGDPTISVLDIFGFENFQVNSFEQLCINYANERLQQLFCHHLVRREKAEYEAEGVEWALVDSTDNSVTLSLLDERNELGVLPLLNDACLLPASQHSSGSTADDHLAERLRSKHQRHPCFYAPPTKRDVFGIRHFAELVEYTVGGMVAKNRDVLPPELMKLMVGSESVLMQGWGEARQKAAMEALSKGGGRSKQLVAYRFKAEVDKLVKLLAAAQPHFVRCIKPNPALQPHHLDTAAVVSQLKWAGVLEVAEIYKKGFPTRFVQEVVVKRYNNDLFPTSQRVQGSNAKDMCRLVLGRHGLREERDFVMGYTKVFFRAGRVAQLEDQWLLRRRAVATISAAWRRLRLHRVVSNVLQEARRRGTAAATIQNSYRTYRRNKRLRALQSHMRAMLRSTAHPWASSKAGEAAVQLPEDPAEMFPAATPALLQELHSDRTWLQYEAGCLASSPQQAPPSASLSSPPRTPAASSRGSSRLPSTWNHETAGALHTWLSRVFFSAVQHPDQQLLINLVTSLDQYAAAMDQALGRLLRQTGGVRPAAEDKRTAAEVARVKKEAATWCSKFQSRMADVRCHLRRVQAASAGCPEAEAATRQLLQHLSELRDTYFNPWRGRVLDALEEVEPLERPATRVLNSRQQSQAVPSAASFTASIASRTSSKLSSAFSRWKL